MIKVCRDIALELAIAFVAGLAVACGSQNSDEVTPATCVRPADPGCSIAVHDSSFVRWTGPGTDATSGGASTAVVRYSRGLFCMSGAVDAGPDGQGWGALLAIGFDQVDAATDMVLPTFHAAALGIAQLRFALAGLPPSGVLPQITQIQSLQCTQLPDCVTTFDRTSAVSVSGTLTVPLSDFSIPDTTHPSAILDRDLITGVHFFVSASPEAVRSYDFCVGEFAFLDESGRAITP